MIGIARTGIRLLLVVVVEMGEAIISFETERRRVTVVDEIGVSERVHGIDACVLVDRKSVV